MVGAAVGTLFAVCSYRMVYRGVWDWRGNHIPLEGGGGEREMEMGGEGEKRDG